MPEKLLIPHTLTLENRNSMSVTGVLQVIAYDEFHIILKTDYGQLIIQGKNLVAGEISSVNNTLKLTGGVENIQYKSLRDKSQGLWAKLSR